MRLPSLALGFLLGAAIFIAASIVIAWAGPTSAPPGGNVAAPLNVGATDQIKDGGLGLDALAVFGNAILSGAARYLNFGDAAGESGYGIRDNGGTLQFKNREGSWATFLPSTNVQSITFIDGTTQTTASTASDAGTLCGLARASATGFTGANCTSFTSIVTCKGVSVASSCPADYTLRTVTTASGSTSGGSVTITCLRTCSKN